MTSLTELVELKQVKGSLEVLLVLFKKGDMRSTYIIVITSLVAYAIRLIGHPILIS